MADHTGFIVAAYAVTAAVFAGLVAAILLDYRAQQRALATLGIQIAPRDGRSAPIGGAEDGGDVQP